MKAPRLPKRSVKATVRAVRLNTRVLTQLLSLLLFLGNMRMHRGQSCVVGAASELRPYIDKIGISLLQESAAVTFHAMSRRVLGLLYQFKIAVQYNYSSLGEGDGCVSGRPSPGTRADPSALRYIRRYNQPAQLLYIRSEVDIPANWRATSAPSSVTIETKLFARKPRTSPVEKYS